MASMLRDRGTWTWPAPSSSRHVPDTPGIQALAGSARTSVPSLPFPELSRATLLPGPSSSDHHPTRSRSSGFGESTTSSTCGAHPAAITAATIQKDPTRVLLLKARTQADIREHRRAVEAPGLRAGDVDA